MTDLEKRNAEEKGKYQGYVEAMALELHACREKVGKLQREIMKLTIENKELRGK